MTAPTTRTTLRELAALSLRLGVTAFGGPPVHIAMLKEQVVTQRAWLDEQQFMDILGATNLIPGPNSTQMVLHVGYLRRGLIGMLVSGICFISPAVFITGLVAYAYVALGNLIWMQHALVGIKPAIVAVMSVAIWRLGKPLVQKDVRLLLLGAVVLFLALQGTNQILAMAIGGFLGMAWLKMKRLPTSSNMMLVPWLTLGSSENPTIGPATLPALQHVANQLLDISTWDRLWPLTAFFLQIGAVLYGGGYVLAAFIQSTLVEHWHWLSQQELLDSIAVGQFTPGPVLSTATFIGYVIGAKQTGATFFSTSLYALLASVAIFLPSFVMVPFLSCALARVKKWSWASAFLDAINISAMAIMSWIVIQLARAVLVFQHENHMAANHPLLVIFAATLGIALYWPKFNIAWILLAASLVGIVLV